MLYDEKLSSILSDCSRCCTRRKRLISAVRSARPGGMPNIARFTAGLQLRVL